MSESALALVESVETPAVVMQRVREVVDLCRVAVLDSVMDIRGKRYLKVEGWCTIAAAFACAPSIIEVIEEERGIKAVAELKRADGFVVARAEGYCGLDEPEWSNRPMYARRGMAQTRAASRVCRTVFAFVLKLIDSGIQTTPAEEIPASEATVTVLTTPGPVLTNRSKAPAERSKATTVRFGKSRGKFLCDIDAADLAWQLAAARKSVDANDPKWSDSNKEWLTTVEAEVARRAT